MIHTTHPDLINWRCAIELRPETADPPNSPTKSAPAVPKLRSFWNPKTSRRFSYLCFVPDVISTTAPLWPATSTSSGTPKQSRRGSVRCIGLLKLRSYGIFQRSCIGACTDSRNSGSRRANWITSRLRFKLQVPLPMRLATMALPSSLTTRRGVL